MTSTKPLLETYPRELALDPKALADTIDVVIECAEACTACADACLSEGMIAGLARCIRTNMDCADVCAATARVLSRHNEYDAGVSRAMLEACIEACRSCGDECARHAREHEHCRLCADACGRAEQACRDLLAAMPAPM